MHRHHIIVFTQSATANTTQFLHVATNTKQKTEMHTQRTDVCASFTTDPENSEMAVIVKFEQLRLIDCTDAKLALDGRNQGRALKQGTRERL